MQLSVFKCGNLGGSYHLSFRLQTCSVTMYMLCSCLYYMYSTCISTCMYVHVCMYMHFIMQARVLSLAGHRSLTDANELFQEFYVHVHNHCNGARESAAADSTVWSHQCSMLVM